MSDNSLFQEYYSFFLDSNNSEVDWIFVSVCTKSILKILNFYSPNFLSYFEVVSCFPNIYFNLYFNLNFLFSNLLNFHLVLLGPI